MTPNLPEELTKFNAPLPPSSMRRIRRHVTSQNHIFFAATAPGLETLCQTELAALGIPAAQIQTLAGGVEFTARLDACYRANLHLRTANRILMRIAEFKATGFGALEKKTASVPWELLLPTNRELDLRVTTKNSRLMHTEAISERMRRAISTRPWQTDLHPGAMKQRLYVRAVKDRFTLSIDTSGQHLYKRGIKTHAGRAPLRETTAAGILKIAGFRPDRILLDPMCGSGSFSIEAALMARNIPAGWYRRFAFMQWPAFRSRQWAYIRKEALAAVTPAEKPGTPIIASDKDPSACQMLLKSLEKTDLSQTIQVKNIDFFDASRSWSGMEPGLIVFNPPYGKRIGNKAESRRLVNSICEKLSTDFSGWRFALLAPPQCTGYRFPLACDTRPLHHGGLELVLYTGTVAAGVKPH